MQCSKEIPELIDHSDTELSLDEDNDISSNSNQSITTDSNTMKTVVFLRENKDINTLKNILKPKCRKTNCKCVLCVQYRECIVPVVKEELKRRKLFFDNLSNIVSVK